MHSQTDTEEDPSSPKTLLVVNTGSVKKRFILQRLSKLPYTVVVLNTEKNWAEPYVDDWIIANTNRHAHAIQQVLQYHKKHPIDGVVTFWEDDVLLTSKIVDALGVVGIPHEIAARTRNKLEFRQFCAKNGLPVPKFLEVKLDDNLQQATASLTFPLVVKPALGSSSAYVIKVENQVELDKTVEYMKKNLSTQVESSLHDGTTIMVEEYIDGDEVDIDILLQNGKIKFWSMSDNFPTREPFFVETGQAIPTVLPESVQKELVDMAELVLEKIGIIHGCIHFEAKYSRRGPVPIEVNMRMGGDEVYSFVKTAWRVDMIEYSAMIALGEYMPKIEKPIQPYSYLTGKYFLPDESGILATLEYPEKFSRSQRVNDFHFFKEIGDTVLVPPASYEYMGWLTVEGDNPNDADDNLAKAIEQVEYEIVPFSEISTMGKTRRRSPLSAAILQSTQVRQGEKIARVRLIGRDQQRKLVIGIAYNSSSKLDGGYDSAQVGTQVAEALESRGYKTVMVDFSSLSVAFDVLEAGKVDLVCNVTEHINGSSLLVPHVSALCDVLKIPYAGSNPLTSALCADKIKVKKLLTFHDIPTASWDYVHSLDESIDDELQFPLLVKPANTDYAIGITQQSVVNNKRELLAQLQYITVTLNRPALIEEYLPGDEFIVSIMGNRADTVQVLPLTRILYDDLPRSVWHILSSTSGVRQETNASHMPQVQQPAKNISAKLSALISEMALDTYRIMGVHDYGRIEIKLDEHDNPHVLEINAHPSIDPNGYLASSAGLLGMEYGDFLEEIIALTIQRYREHPPFYHLQSFG